MNPLLLRNATAFERPASCSLCPTIAPIVNGFWLRVATRLEHGADPAAVAQVVHRADTASAPCRRYQVGREATLLRILRSLAPYSIMDGGIRNSFGLGAAS